MNRIRASTVVVYRTGQLGDAIVAIPAVRAIRDRHPKSTIVLLTDRHPPERGWVSSWDVLRAASVFDDVVFYSPARSATELLRLVPSLGRKLRRLRPNTVYNLAQARTRWQSQRDRLFFGMVVGAVDYHAPEPEKCHNWIERGTDRSRALPEWLRLLSAVPGPHRTPNGALDVPEDARRRAREILNGAWDGESKRMIVVAPGSKMPAKRWPVEYYATLLQELARRRPGVRYLVMGDGNDVALGEALVAENPTGCVNLAGRLSIMEAAAILQVCSLFVGNDTGTMHLAAAVGTPCIAIFSARDQEGAWEPFGEGHRVFRLSPPCAGCMLEVCTTNRSRCLTGIDPGSVVDAAESMLSMQQAAVSHA